MSGPAVPVRHIVTGILSDVRSTSHLSPRFLSSSKLIGILGSKFSFVKLGKYLNYLVRYSITVLTLIWCTSSRKHKDLQFVSSNSSQSMTELPLFRVNKLSWWESRQSDKLAGVPVPLLLKWKSEPIQGEINEGWNLCHLSYHLDPS